VSAFAPSGRDRYVRILAAMRLGVLSLVWMAIASGCGSNRPQTVPVATAPTNPWAAPAGVPARELHVTNGSVQLYGRVFGGTHAKSTLLVLPGGPGGSHDYLEALARFASDELQIVEIDARGSGKSSAPSPADYTMTAYASDIDAVLEALAVKRVILMGHSWGSVPALGYATLHPDRVATLILAGAGEPSYEQDQRTAPAMMARIQHLQEQGIIPKQLPAMTGPDCMPFVHVILPAEFIDPRNPATKSFPGTWSCDVMQTYEQAFGSPDCRCRSSSCSATTTSTTSSRPHAISRRSSPARSCCRTAATSHGSSARRPSIPRSGRCSSKWMNSRIGSRCPSAWLRGCCWGSPGSGRRTCARRGRPRRAARRRGSGP
jgi:pimeloyl-ACP methyl ester carboxylesterase